MIKVILPTLLRELTKIEGEVQIDSGSSATVQDVLEKLEQKYPALRGTLRDKVSGKRKPMIRFFACEKDFSNLPLNTALPAEVVEGKLPLIIVAAIAGG